MGKIDTTFLADQIKRGKMSLNDLTRKERKAVLQSMSVSKEQREFQRETQINQNQYMEIEIQKRTYKNMVKAEKVGWDWGFSQKGFKQYAEVIENMFQGTQKEIDGFLIYKATTNEAVIIEE